MKKNEGEKKVLKMPVWRKHSKDMFCNKFRSKEILDHEASYEILKLVKDYMENELVEFFTSVSERRKVNKTDGRCCSAGRLGS